jgi:uroporphyrinogen-III synthase
MTPQHHVLPVLLTRPAAQADRFAAELVTRFADGILPVSTPLLTPVFLSPSLPDGPFSALILTSETGLAGAVRLREAGARLPRRAFCVGDRTAATAQAAGFEAVSAAGNAEALISLILSSGESGPFLHMRGKEARGDIVPRLVAKGQRAEAAVVYAQQPLALTAQAREVLAGDGPVLVPLFSPRTAQILCEQGPFKAPLWVVAISPAAAREALPLNAERLVVAERPDAAAMLDAAGRLIGFPCA